MFNNPSQTNQTKFALEEPLLEEVAMPEIPDAPDPAQTEPESFFEKNKKLLLLALVAVVTIILAAVLLAMMNGNNGQSQPITPPSPSPVSGQTSPFTNRVKEIRKDLDAADPTSQNHPFPQVDLELRLDEPDN